MEPAGVETSQVLPPGRIAPRLYAGFWRRVLAWFIDALAISAMHVVLTVFFGTWLLLPWALAGGVHDALMAKAVDTSLQPFGIVVAWLYYAVCESARWQATPGKLALGLRVTDEHGERIGFARATGRYFGKFVSALTLCIGFLLAGWTVRKQALHDLMAGCCVVRAGGLAAWRLEEISRTDAAAPIAVPAVRAGMPGWAIALIVIVGGVFVGLPLLATLAAIAVPAYRNYTVRTEIAQGIALTGRPRALVAEYIGARGALPGDNAALGLPRPEAIQARYVTSVRVVEGKVVVTYGNQASPVIRGGHVVVSPYGNAALLHWQCSSRDIQTRYLPTNCRD
ncbi:MAG: RDD family protein [Proteobacteria bacterium]|nr:RDD family protein [Pseudomonadota bacterium]